MVEKFGETYRFVRREPLVSSSSIVTQGRFASPDGEKTELYS
jgi:hypothetical protein